tara:strand:- start:138 stop:572 length:435 start_codon:yes stop_codon:yes gene_type:complete
MNKEQKEIIKRINKAYSSLFILSNITWTPYRDDLFNMNRKEEKQHRAFGNDWAKYHENSASINDCARLFTVKHIAESLLTPNKYKVKDLLNIKKSCLFAQSLVDNYKDRIVKAWSNEDFTYLANLDYIALVNWELYQEQQLKRA